MPEWRYFGLGSLRDVFIGVFENTADGVFLKRDRASITAPTLFVTENRTNQRGGKFYTDSIVCRWPKLLGILWKILNHFFRCSWNENAWQLQTIFLCDLIQIHLPLWKCLWQLSVGQSFQFSRVSCVRYYQHYTRCMQKVLFIWN